MMTELQIIQENLRQLKEAVDRMWDMFEVTKWHAAQYLTTLADQQLPLEEAFEKMCDRYGLAIALELLKDELGIPDLKYRQMLDLKIKIAQNFGSKEPRKVVSVIDSYLKNVIEDDEIIVEAN
jgi:hypothetical protein